MRNLTRAPTWLTNRVIIIINFYTDFPGFGGMEGMGGMGDDELNDEDDMPEMNDEEPEHTHGGDCKHDKKEANLDDLDEEANK